MVRREEEAGDVAAELAAAEAEGPADAETVGGEGVGDDRTESFGEAGDRAEGEAVGAAAADALGDDSEMAAARGAAAALTDAGRLALELNTAETSVDGANASKGSSDAADEETDVSAACTEEALTDDDAADFFAPTMWKSSVSTGGGGGGSPKSSKEERRALADTEHSQWRAQWRDRPQGKTTRESVALIRLFHSSRARPAVRFVGEWLLCGCRCVSDFGGLECGGGGASSSSESSSMGSGSAPAVGSGWLIFLGECVLSRDCSSVAAECIHCSTETGKGPGEGGERWGTVANHTTESAHDDKELIRPLSGRNSTRTPHSQVSTRPCQIWAKKRCKYIDTDTVNET